MTNGDGHHPGGAGAVEVRPAETVRATRSTEGSTEPRRVKGALARLKADVPPERGQISGWLDAHIKDVLTLDRAKGATETAKLLHLNLSAYCSWRVRRGLGRKSGRRASSPQPPPETEAAHEATADTEARLAYERGRADGLKEALVVLVGEATHEE